MTPALRDTLLFHYYLLEESTSQATKAIFRDILPPEQQKKKVLGFFFCLNYVFLQLGQFSSIPIFIFLHFH